MYDDVIITNLETNEDFELDLPMSESELEEFMEENIGDADYAVEITGFNGLETESIKTINELAEAIDYVGIDIEAGEAIFNEVGVNEAISIIKNSDFSYYPDCATMEDVATQYIDSVLDLPDWATFYFDYKAYGDDMYTNGHFVEYDGGYVELY